MNAEQMEAGNAWLIFALMTVMCWGLYGSFLHAGVMKMEDPQLGRYKAFLFVGIAYFLTAVLAPALVLALKGAAWTFKGTAVMWSLGAGLVGAAGAFFVLLAFGAKGRPEVVMSIIFAGAPVVNAIYILVTHPPAGGLKALKPQFLLGIFLAALGGFLVTLYKPGPAGKKRPASTELATPGIKTEAHP